MQIFNTMTRQKEEFVPQKEGEYRIYVCGPTVYNYIHIGNARPMIVFDTLRRYLEYCGNKVYYVSNITDIDDKLIKKGQEEGTSMQEVARKFEAEYIRDSDGLNVKAPTVRPRATEHIGEIIHIVKDLVDSGHAYVARNGDVYFRVKSDPGYGKLSHLNLDDLESGNRELRSRMDDDLNTPDALAAIFDLVKDINTLSDASDKATLETAAKTFDELTGVLGLLYNRKKTDSIPAEVTALVEERAAAKKAKDWGRADAIRAQLTEMGWSVTDTAQGPKLAKL